MQSMFCCAKSTLDMTAVPSPPLTLHSMQQRRVRCTNPSRDYLMLQFCDNVMGHLLRWVYRSLVAQAVTPRSTPLQGKYAITCLEFVWHSLFENEDQVVVYQLPYQLEASRSPDRTWNDIMTHVRLTGYVHPVLASYWGRQLLGPWSPSPVAGLGMLEGLVMRYSIGATADVVVQVLLSMIHDDATADLLAAQTDDHPLLVQLRAAVTDAPLSHYSSERALNLLNIQLQIIRTIVLGSSSTMLSLNSYGLAKASNQHLTLPRLNPPAIRSSNTLSVGKLAQVRRDVHPWYRTTSGFEYGRHVDFQDIGLNVSPVNPHAKHMDFTHGFVQGPYTDSSLGSLDMK
ncbi:hypothetical protein DYB34_004593 [Aphanomyces astaci]|uniref:Uncharacterized protein n=2 Tax=Aphanomyces astaci TaxID=112090 RepID=A0A3R6YL38_APHAT|nr:hypothetical protein DYB34_004593 [Aphanomyces astaci]